MDGITSHPRTVQAIFQLLAGLLRVAENHGSVFTPALLGDILS